MRECIYCPSGTDECAHDDAGAWVRREGTTIILDADSTGKWGFDYSSVSTAQQAYEQLQERLRTGQEFPWVKPINMWGFT